MTKKILLTIFSMWSFVTFAENFKVNIDIKNLGTGVKGSFRQLDGPGFKNIEIVSDNDKILITGDVSEPEMVTVFLSDKRIEKTTDGRGYIPSRPSRMDFFIFPGADVKISGSISDFIDAYPQGDPQNDLLASFHKKLYPILNESVNLRVKSIVDKSLTDVDKDELKQKQKQLDEKAQVLRMEFLSKNTSSWAALALMEDMLIRSQIEMDNIGTLLGKVAPEYKSISYYKSVKKRFDGFIATQVGKQAPTIRTNATIDGSVFDIKDLKGKYVIIDFWGTWCGACIAGMPEMQTFRDRHKDKIEILGIAKDRSMDLWRSFVKEKSMNWPNIFNGKDSENYVELFSVQGYPTKILIDPNGKIAFRMTGERKEFYEEVERIMGVN